MKVRRISITLQILVINIVVLLAASAVLGFVSMKRSREAISEIMQQRMMDIANCAAASVDGDMLEPLTAEDEGSKDYQTVFDTLALYRDTVEVEYIYGIKAVSGRADSIMEMSDGLGKMVSKYNT